MKAESISAPIPKTGKSAPVGRILSKKMTAAFI
jgi:hypothetical protein